jgi:Zn-dependent peptidase ImmA (M78 family)
MLERELGDEAATSYSEERIAAFERGATPVTLVELEALARVYLVPFVALLQSELPQTPVSDFRKTADGRQSPMSYETFKRLDRYDSFHETARRVADALNLTEPRIARVSLTSTRSSADIESLATSIRTSLKLSQIDQRAFSSEYEALEGWRTSVENAGVFVFTLPMDVGECRGASRWEPPGPPSILINLTDAPTAQLFTLLHEYTHLVFTEQPDINLCDPSQEPSAREERLANRVAAAVLMPKRWVMESIPPHVPTRSYKAWPNAARAQMKKLFSVSHAVIGIRLRELGVVKDSGYSASFWKQPTEFRRGKNSPVWQRHRRYLGKRTLSLARQAVTSEHLSVSELARWLDLKVRDVEQAIG